MALTLTTTARNAACDAVVDLADAGAGAAVLEIYTAAFAALLVSITLADPAFGAAAAGVATAGSLPKNGTAVAAGTAAVFKMTDSTATEVWRGTVTATGGGGDLTLDTVTIAVGDLVTLTTGTHTQPA